jgi:MFS family permease
MAERDVAVPAGRDATAPAGRTVAARAGRTVAAPARRNLAVPVSPAGRLPVAGGPALLVLAMLSAAEFLSGFGVMILDISIGAIFAAVIPDKVRSRVTGAFQAVNYGTRPVGALAGGFLGSLIGIRSALWIATIGGALGFLWLLPSPLPRFRMPSTDASTST